MCSHGVYFLAEPDVFRIKIFSHNPAPWQIKNVFSKKISEYLTFSSSFQASWQDLMCSARKKM